MATNTLTLDQVLEEFFSTGEEEVVDNFCDPTSSQHHNSGGGGEWFTLKKINLSKSQLRVLETHRPIWGRVAQGALELCLSQIRK